MAPKDQLCRNCKSKNLIKRGKRGSVQRFRCKDCMRYQQDGYCYQLYNIIDDKRIRMYHSEGLGIRSISCILDYSLAPQDL
jgi:transposase-like protein